MRIKRKEKWRGIKKRIRGEGQERKKKVKIGVRGLH